MKSEIKSCNQTHHLDDSLDHSARADSECFRWVQASWSSWLMCWMGRRLGFQSVMDWTQLASAMAEEEKEKTYFSFRLKAHLMTATEGYH